MPPIRKSFLFVFFTLIMLAGCAAMLAKQPCPATQAGLVSATLSPEGYTVIQVPYKCKWDTVPVLVASPTGQGSLFVARFEANTLTGEVGSIAVFGEPNQTISFSYLAYHP